MSLNVTNMCIACATPCIHICAEGFGDKPAPCTIQLAKGLTADHISRAIARTWTADATNHGQIRCTVSIKLCKIHLKFIIVTHNEMGH